MEKHLLSLYIFASPSPSPSSQPSSNIPQSNEHRDRVMSPLTPSKPNSQYVVKIAHSSSSRYVSSPAMFKGSW
ncbi:hypothetical protein HBI15_215710 [Parastagonospora nodorum]|nr:hypothetical protein HBI15_215710 [Parastagonospora nodorum]